MGNLFICLQDQTIVDRFFAGGQTVDSDFDDVPLLISQGLLLAAIIPPPGISANFLRGDGVWAPASGVVANQKSAAWLSPIFVTSGFGTNRGVAANQWRVLYMGKAPAPMSHMHLRWYTGAAAVAGYAEVFIATGSPPVLNAGTTLTVIGATSAVTEWNTVGPHDLDVTLTPGLQVGDDVWAGYAMDIGTTQIRVSTLDVEDAIGRGKILVRSTATHPSAAVGSPLAFSLDIVGATPPAIEVAI